MIKTKHRSQCFVSGENEEGRRKYNARIILYVEFAIAAATSGGILLHWNLPMYDSRELSPMWIRLINFFPRLSATCTFSSAPNFPVARVRKPLASYHRENKREREPVQRSLIFLSFRQACSRRGPFGDSEYVRERVVHPPHRSPTLRVPPAVVPNHLFVCPRNDQRDMLRAQRKTFIYHPPRKQGRLAGHAVATREEKSGRFISQKGGTARFMSALAYTDALAVSPLRGV